MGIKKLMKVLMERAPGAIHQINPTNLNNKKIAIDTSIIMYQFMTAIKTSGGDLQDVNGVSTSHIHAILSKTLYYLKLGIIPVHVFDGKASELKQQIINERTTIKKNAIAKIIEIDEQIQQNAEQNAEQNTEQNTEQNDRLNAEKIKLMKQTVKISHKEMMEAVEIVDLLGVPYILSPEEADSQCAYLSRNNLVDYVASEDMDLLTFGTKSLIRHFLKKGMCEIKLDEILINSDTTMEEFIDICILLGCDYTDTIEGIGEKKSWDLIKRYKNIETLIAKEKKIASTQYKLPDIFKYEEAREYFTNLRYVEKTADELKLKKPNFDKLKQLLIMKYNYDEHNIENMLKFLRKKYNEYEDGMSLISQKVMTNDIFLDDDSPNETQSNPQSNPQSKTQSNSQSKLQQMPKSIVSKNKNTSKSKLKTKIFRHEQIT